MDRQVAGPYAWRLAPCPDTAMEPTAELSSTTSTRGPIPALAMLWLAGLSLRVTVLALPASLNAITGALGLDAGDVGILTAIPSLCFALASIPGALLIRRVGTSTCLLSGLALNVAGAVARGFAPGTTALEASTAAMAFGVALTQVAMPSLVKQWLSDRVGLATAIYTFGLLCGEIAPVAAPFPVPAGLLGAAWRSQLAAWAIPVALTFCVILLFGRGSEKRAVGGHAWPRWTDRALWPTGLLIGAVNAVYFGLNGFLPLWLSRVGLGGRASEVLFALNLAQLPAAFLMMAMAERLVGRWWVYVAASLALLGATLALALAPSAAPIAAAALAGFCLALLLALALTVPPLVSPPDELPGLTAGAFTLGYGIAVVMALATGWLDEVAPPVVGVAPIAVAALAVASIGAMLARLIGATSRRRTA